MSGRLILCATPIGNLGDASARLAETLAAADAVFAEDTRRARTLLEHCGSSVRPESYYAGNEAQKSGRLERLLQSGATVALIADAGTPGVSDPGRRAVQDARRAGAEVSVVPGPSAVTAALAVSGFSGGRFAFEGFLPRRGGDRTRRLEALAGEERPTVLFAAPHHLAEDLESLAEGLGGERRVCAVRELTKLYEEVWWGTLAEAADRWGSETPRGEFTLVIAGAEAGEAPLEGAVAEVLSRMESGTAMSDAVREVARSVGLGRRTLYEAVLGRRDG